MSYQVYAGAPSWKTSTYRLRIFLFDACDFGLPGGGPDGASLEPVGVLGADSMPGEGTKLERTRIPLLLGGEELKSIADAALAGGGPVGGPAWALGGGLEPVIPGDAV